MNTQNSNITQAREKGFLGFGGTPFVDLTAVGRSADIGNSTGRSVLRPANGTPAVTRHIASPFEALPGVFRFSCPGRPLVSVLPGGITELMRDPGCSN